MNDPAYNAERLYAGVGSRQTPHDVLDYMRRLAGRLAARGFVLRSGGAEGADTAFETGCTIAGGRQEIWLPWRGYNGHMDTGLYPTKAHQTVASHLHPVWNKLGSGARLLHARNVGQVLGMTLEAPVSFVVCWTADGAENSHQCSARTGGTGTAIALASLRNIPVFNLKNAGAQQQLAACVLSLLGE